MTLTVKEAERRLRELPDDATPEERKQAQEDLDDARINAPDEPATPVEPTTPTEPAEPATPVEPATPTEPKPAKRERPK
jgi:hypothetical protein